MILGKLWRTIQAQLNKLVDFFWAADPIAAMQQEYDRAVAQLREGRVGLAEYRAFVERVGRQVARNEANVRRLEATVKTYLKRGDRESAGRFVLELQRARQELAENQGQLRMHEQAYENNLLKIKHASGKLAEIRDKIARYDADLKMSAAEAEMARLAQDFHVNVTTDFGQLESSIQEKIDLNRAKGARGRGPLRRGCRGDPPGRGDRGAACRGRASRVRASARTIRRAGRSWNRAARSARAGQDQGHRGALKSLGAIAESLQDRPRSGEDTQRRRRAKSVLA